MAYFDLNNLNLA